MISIYRNLLILTGTILNAFSLSLPCFFGNVLPYIDSYYYEHRDKISLYVSPLWTVSVSASTFILGMMLTSAIEHRLGIYISVLAGDILLTFSFFSVYFLIKEPLALALIFGCLQGTSFGIVYALIVKLLLQEMPNHGGFAAGIMSAGSTVGAVLFIGVAFAVINPSNKKPDLKVDNKVYFSDKNLLNRVPTYFTVLGAITAASTLIGAALMYVGSKNHFHMDKAKANTDKSIYEQLDSHSDKCQTPGTVQKKELVPLKVSDAQLYGDNGQNKDFKAKMYKASSCLNGDPNTDEIQNNGLAQDTLNDQNGPLQEYVNKAECEVLELSPREALKTARFWLVWLAFVTSNHTFYIHLALYKEYGEQAISDDSMLITTGIISNVSTIFICPLVGIASDRIGIRKTSMILNAASCLFMSLMVIAIHTCPWMYMVLVVIENIGVAPHTMIFSIIAAFEFGKIHCASNMGFIRTGNIPLVLLEPFIVDALIRAIGWDWVFLTGSLSSAIATIAIIALDFF